MIYRSYRSRPTPSWNAWPLLGIATTDVHFSDLRRPILTSSATSPGDRRTLPTLHLSSAAINPSSNIALSTILEHLTALPHQMMQSEILYASFSHNLVGGVRHVLRFSTLMMQAPALDLGYSPPRLFSHVHDGKRKLGIV